MGFIIFRLSHKLVRPPATTVLWASRNEKEGEVGRVEVGRAPGGVWDPKCAIGWVAFTGYEGQGEELKIEKGRSCRPGPNLGKADQPQDPTWQENVAPADSSFICMCLCPQHLNNTKPVIATQ